MNADVATKMAATDVELCVNKFSNSDNKNGNTRSKTHRCYVITAHLCTLWSVYIYPSLSTVSSFVVLISCRIIQLRPEAFLGVLQLLITPLERFRICSLVW